VAEVELEVWLQTEQGDGTFTCKAFSGVPSARLSWVALASSGSARARDYAAQLSRELQSVLLTSSPEVSCREILCPAELEEMQPEKYRSRRKLLVLLGSEDRAFEDLKWYEHWNSDALDSSVMTVLPPGKYEDFFNNEILQDDKHLLRRVNASTWKENVAEALPAILARAEITSAATRVFISYRRLETLQVALQLFDRLTHEGFEVFLDRFSIPPGYDFQRRLTQELEDKSMIVLLESKFLKDSKWTQHEIDFAKRNRLGLMSVRMPDVEEQEVIPSVSFDSRVALTKTDFICEPTEERVATNKMIRMKQWSALTDNALEGVVADIKRTHASALFRRRHRLRSDLVAQLRTKGLAVQYQSAGPLLVTWGTDEHLIWPTTRPPEVEDFRVVSRAQFPRKVVFPTSKGIIVGPQAALEPDRKERLSWLHEVSGCLSFDEGNLAEIVRRVAECDWK